MNWKNITSFWGRRGDLNTQILKVLHKFRDDASYVDLTEHFTEQTPKNLWLKTQELKEQGYVEVKDQFLGSYTQDSDFAPIKTEVKARITLKGSQFYKTAPTNTLTKIIKNSSSSLILRIISGLIIGLTLYYIFGIRR